MSRQDFESFCLLLRRWLVRESCDEPGQIPHSLHRQRSVSNLQVLDLSDNRLGSASMSDLAQAIMDASKVQPPALTQLMLRGEKDKQDGDDGEKGGGIELKLRDL